MPEFQSVDKVTHVSTKDSLKDKIEPQKTTKKRDMNFELLRIICMILIITSHCIMHSEIMNKVNLYTANYYFLEFLMGFSKISVNLYILITGYYMVKSKFKTKKLISIWGITFFYSFFTVIVCELMGQKLGKKVIIMNLLPFMSGRYWFVTTYIGLYVLIPFINRLINGISKKQYELLVSVLFFMLVVAKTIFSDINYLEPNSGNNLFWFCYLYIIGAYIRLYYDEKINKNIYLMTSFLSGFINFAIRIIGIKFLDKDFVSLLYFSTIFNFISTITFFLYFKEIKIRGKIINTIIGKIAPATFGVYLLHDNFLTKKQWLKFVMQDYSFVNTHILIPRFIVTVLLVFAVCITIEIIRKKIFDLIRNTNMFNKFKNTQIIRKIDNIAMKIDNIVEQ